MLGETRNRQEIKASDAKKVNLRLTHPGLYKSIMLFAVLTLAMAWNYFNYKPTFSPYNIEKEVIGSIFLSVGVVFLLLLNVFRNFKLLRTTEAIAAALLIFWAVINTKQAFEGKASFALPILLLYAAFTILKDLLEPPVNPMTRRDNDA